MVKYCRTENDVRQTLVRIAHRKTRRPLLIFVCDACNLVQAPSISAVVMGGKIYCESDALKKARSKEPTLTEDDFKRRLRPCDEIAQLLRYESVP